MSVTYSPELLFDTLAARRDRFYSQCIYRRVVNAVKRAQFDTYHPLDPQITTIAFVRMLRRTEIAPGGTIYWSDGYTDALPHIRSLGIAGLNTLNAVLADVVTE